MVNPTFILLLQNKIKYMLVTLLSPVMKINIFLHELFECAVTVILWMCFLVICNVHTVHLRHFGSNFNTFLTLQNIKYSLQITCCPGCRKPMPRCSLCLSHMGTASGLNFLRETTSRIGKDYNF